MGQWQLTVGQVWGLVGLVLGALIVTVILYSMRQKKRVRYLTVHPILALGFISLTFIKFIEGDAFWAFSAWISSIVTLSIVLDLLVSAGRELNEKLAVSLMLIVVVAGGILANAYIFSMPTTMGTRILSFSALILSLAPILLASIVYSIGKRKLSKRIIGALTWRLKD